jgi:hypothetical protein
VRQKALQGPIGVDNSEVINLEMERELKKRNKHLLPETKNVEDEEDLPDEDIDHVQN